MQGVGYGVMMSTICAADFCLKACKRSRVARILLGLMFTLAIPFASHHAFAATVSWDGGGDGSTWSNAANWDTNAVPTAADDVVINVAGTITATITSGSVTVKSIQCEEGLTIAAGSLTVTAPSVVNGSFQMLSNTSLTVSGSGATFVANGSTTVSTVHFYAQSGGQLSLPNLMSYAGSSVFHSQISATGIGSSISLPGLVSFTGGINGAAVFVSAVNGGQIPLLGLTSLQANIAFFADGTGSFIDISNVTTYVNSATGHDLGYLRVRNGGSIDASSLTASTGVGYKAENTTYGLSTTLSVPALTGLLGHLNWNTVILASGESSTVDLPAVLSMDGGYYTSITARSGGQVLLAAMTTMQDMTSVLSEGTGSHVDLSSVTTYNNAATTHDKGWIEVLDGGTIDVSSLSSAVAVGFKAINTIPGVSTVLTLPALTSFIGDYVSGWRTNITCQGDSSVISMPGLISAGGGGGSFEVAARSGGHLELSSATSLHDNTAFISEGFGSHIDLSGASSFVKSVDGNDSCWLSVINGGSIDASVLANTVGVGFKVTNTIPGVATSLVLPSLVTVAGYSPTWRTYITVDGDSSVLEMPAVSSVNGQVYLAVTASSGGQILLPSAANLLNNIMFLSDGLGSHIDLSSANGFVKSVATNDVCWLQVLDGGTIDASALTNTVGVGFKVNNTIPGVATNLALPSLTSVAGDPTWRTYIAADGDSSVLDMSAVSSVNGQAYLAVTASSGGQVHIPNATTLLNNIMLLSEDVGSHVDISDATSFSKSAANHDVAWLKVLNGGTLNASSLISSDGVGYKAVNTVPGQTTVLTLPALVTVSAQSTGWNTFIIADGNSSTVNMPSALTVGGGGGLMEVRARNAGVLNMPALQFLTGTPTSVYAEGGTVSLNSSMQSRLLDVDVTFSSSGVLQGHTINADTQSSLTGAGTINGNLTSSASISPQRVITVNGNFLQSAGALNIDLAGIVPGTLYDQFVVSGTASLAGSLAITVIGPFVPAQADKFDVLLFGSRTGEFNPVTGLNLGGGRTLKTIYRPNKLVIGELAGLISPPVPAIVTDQNVPYQIDLSPYGVSAAQPTWDIDPADTALYSATIGVGDILTISPKFNAFGSAAPSLTLIDTSSGFDDTQALEITVAQVLPTAPVAAVIFPESPLETENLYCAIQGGSVAPLLFPYFEYVWTSSTGKELSPHISASPFDQLDASNTDAGEVWTCTVRTYDGAYYSLDAATATSASIVGLANSTLSLVVAPGTVTLGSYAVLSGEISPVVGVTSILFEDTVPPSGGAKPATILTDSSSQFASSFLPNVAGAWGFGAKWEGNNSYHGDSELAVLVVERAQPSLALELSASSAPLNYASLTATATLTAPIPGQLKPLLGSRTVRLFLKKPDASSVGPVVGTTDANGVATFTPQMFADAGIAFSDAGTWQFIAEFPGDTNFLTATSAPFDQPESVRLTIKDRAGYAVLVLGKLDANAEGHAEHARTADFAYRAFRERGFATEDIYYLREGDAQPAPDIFVSDTTPTKAEVQAAIQTWARTKMNAAPAPLYVVFIDHGATDAFYVYSGAFDATRVISPTDLDGYFDTLEGQLNGQALSQPRVFVYGACHSGSFIPAVSAENRVVITSAGADEVSHRGTTDPDTGVRDGEVFVTELFRNARSGKTLKESFELASEKTEEYTATRSNDGTAELPQRALLDDNGDGAGSSRTALAFEDGYDGSAAHTLVLGYGVNAGDPVSWIEASQTRTLETGEAMSPLEARAIPAPTTGDTAWIEVKTPAYVGGELAALDLPDFQQTVPMQRFDAEAGISEPGTGTYRWSDFGTTFDAPGTYKVFYYIKDAATGDVSTHILTTVFRAAPGNRAPTPVTQIYPNNGQSVYSTTFFAWTESSDPDGDGITYRVEIAEDSGFTTGLLVEDGIVGTLTQIGGLVDGTTYYWRVWPVDEYGLSPDTATVRSFTVDNNNPALPGSVVGRVRNLLTLEPVAGATVTLSPGNTQWTTGSNGEYFFFQVTPGAYTVNVTATSYIGGSQLASVFAGSTATADFLLTSLKPVLTVTPEAHSVGAAGGPLSFSVSNTGSGVMTYSATVIAGDDWLSIGSGASGGNTGTIHVNAAASNVTQPRTGRIRITALGVGGIAATSSPREVLVAQEAGADGVPPVITRLGSSPVSVEQYAAYTDAGATATDNVDGDITANVQSVSTVDTGTIGSYTVTYTVSDSSGNPATPVVRTVNVVAATHAEGTIGPLGGTVSRDGITVTILPGALSAPTLITIDRAPVDDPTLPEGVLAVLNGTSFDVGPDGLTAVGGGDLATVTISYPDADQDGIVDGTTIPEEYLVVLHIDETSGDVTVLEGTINTTANTVTVTTPSFSVFVVAQSESLPGVPIQPWTVVVLALFMLVSGVGLIRRPRTQVKR